MGPGRQICRARDGNFEQLHPKQNFWCLGCSADAATSRYYTSTVCFAIVFLCETIFPAPIATTPYSKEILQRWRQCGPAQRGRKRRARKAILARWSTQKSRSRRVPRPRILLLSSSHLLPDAGWQCMLHTLQRSSFATPDLTGV